MEASFGFLRQKSAAMSTSDQGNQAFSSEADTMSVLNTSAPDINIIILYAYLSDL